MKKILVLLMTLGLFVAACNNNKTGKNQNSNIREKDDYGKSDNVNNADENKTTDNSGNSGWTEKDKNKFLKDCVEAFHEGQAVLANKICPCALEKIQKEFTSLSEADSKGGEAAGQRIALQCKDEIVGNSDNNTVNTWSISDENKFREECAGEATKKVGAARADQYCDCMLQKMKKMYLNYDDANRKLGEVSQEDINAMSVDCNRK